MLRYHAAMSLGREARDRLGLLLVLVIVVGVSLPGLLARSIWHDEAITLLETADGPTDWPQDPKPAAVLKQAFQGRRGVAEMVEVLRATDIHPPVYYWALSFWKAAGGPSLEAARLFSLATTVASVVLFFLLLRSADFSRPFMPLLVFGLSTSTVHYAHEARNYSLAMMLLLLATLLAHRSLAGDRTDNARRRLGLAAAGGVAAAAAFLTSYFAVFWLAPLLLWHALLAWRRDRTLPLMFSGLFVLLGGGGFVALRLYEQLSRRPHQYAGFHGFAAELRGMVVAGLGALCGTENFWGRRLLLIVIAGLVGLTLLALTRRGVPMPGDPKVMALFTGIVVATMVGILAIDVGADKHFYQWSRYYLFALPPVALFLTRGVEAARGPVTRTGGLLLLGLLTALQLSAVNWGEERCRGATRMGAIHRSVCAAIRASPAARVAALVGVGNGRGDVWSYVYEMAGDLPVAFIDWSLEPRQVAVLASRFDEIWVLRAFDGMTRGKELAAWDALLASGQCRDEPTGLGEKVLRARCLHE